MPQLDNVKGAFNIQSTKTITNSCSAFGKLKNQGIIRGKYICAGKLSHVGGVSNPQASQSSSSGGSSSSSSAANPIYISGATGVMGVVAAIFGML